MLLAEKSRDTTVLLLFRLGLADWDQTNVKKWSLISLIRTPAEMVLDNELQCIWSMRVLLSFWILVAF
jgi:hypothetical protein